MHVEDLLPELQQVKKQRRRYVVWQVPDHANTIAKRGEVKLQRISFMHRNVRVVFIPATQPGDQVAIEFHGMQMSGTAGERVGDRRLAWSDLDDDVILGRMYCANDGIDDARVSQEMLTETLACAVFRHQLRAMMTASSTAAIRLDGSA